MATTPSTPPQTISANNLCGLSAAPLDQKHKTCCTSPNTTAPHRPPAPSLFSHYIPMFPDLIPQHLPLPLLSPVSKTKTGPPGCQKVSRATGVPEGLEGPAVMVDGEGDVDGVKDAGDGAGRGSGSGPGGCGVCNTEIETLNLNHHLIFIPHRVIKPIVCLCLLVSVWLANIKCLRGCIMTDQGY